MVAPTSNRRLGQGAALGLPLQAQEGEGHDTLHHPPQDQCCTKNAIERGTCPIIYRLAVAWWQ
jgi:hypothetical protein